MELPWDSEVHYIRKPKEETSEVKHARGHGRKINKNLFN